MSATILSKKYVEEYKTLDVANARAKKRLLEAQEHELNLQLDAIDARLEELEPPYQVGAVVEIRFSGSQRYQVAKLERALGQWMVQLVEFDGTDVKFEHVLPEKFIYRAASELRESSR